MNRLTKIELGLENCDVITIDEKYIQAVYLKDVSENYAFYKNNENSKGSDFSHKLAKDVMIGIYHPKEIKHTELGILGFTDDVTTVYDRILSFPDITDVKLIFENEEQDIYFVDFNEENEYINANQVNEYDEETDVLKISIREKNNL